MEFTPAQQAAINDRGENILVSASAGSGKTRVLVERVLKRLLAGEDVDRFLIVTFTEAAAAEMKERLETAIRQAVQTEQGAQRRHLLKQLRLLNVANISTLHAFARRLISQYHYTIDLDPQFRISDDAERTLMMQEVFTDLVEQHYLADEAKVPADRQFGQMVEQFKTASQSDQPFQEAVFRLFDFAMARPDSDDWLTSLPKAYESADDFAQTPFYQETVLPSLKAKIDELVALAQQAVDTMPDTADEEAALNRQAQLWEDLTVFQQVQTAIHQADSSWDSLRQLVLSAALPKWGSARNKQAKASRFKDPIVKAAWEDIKTERDTRTKAFATLKTAYFALDSAGQALAMTGSQQTLKTLIAFTAEFKAAFLAAKIQRKTLDFNDLEHFALAIVKQPRVAEELRQHYSEIMVDEYQDTNQLQEAILSAIAQDDNTFQVGDIKQSIYRFRQADPRLFAQKLKTYPKQVDSEVITLQENFRSQPNVTNFINYIFAQLMSADLGDVDYRDEAELVAGAQYYPDSIAKEADLLIYLSDQEDSDEHAGGLSQGDQDYSATSGQIRMMANKIQQMVADPDWQIFDRKRQERRRVTYGDITILVPTKSQNLDVLDIFRSLDIPIAIDGAENFFQTTEISVMMSYLQIIDNPHQDIPLAAVLRSPLYNVDENGLALIRAQQDHSDYFEAVAYFASQPLEKLEQAGLSAAQVLRLQATVQRFMDDLTAFHQLAVQNQIVDLIWQIYNRTGWLDYVGGLPAGAQRQANLHALYQRAARYQRSSFVGLYQFINYVNELEKQDRDLGSADANTSENTVRLMTIHHAKGLEFPVVFLLNSNRQMVSNNEVTGDLLVDAQAGAGLDYVDLDHHLQLPTLQKEMVKEARQRAAFAEQLRVLYVALTRAEQNVFIVAADKNMQRLRTVWSLQAQGREWMYPEWVRLAGKSYLDLIGLALMRHPDAQKALAATNITLEDLKIEDQQLLSPKAPFNFSIHIWDQSTLQAAEDAMASQANQQPLQTSSSQPIVNVSVDWRKFLHYDYPYAAATRATAYQSVSELKRLFEDPDLQAGRIQADRRLPSAQVGGLRYVDSDLAQPKFMQNGQARISSAAVGTATHLVMQRLNLQAGRPKSDQVKDLIQRLVADHAIEAAVAPLIRVDQIVAFFETVPLGKQMVAHADSLEREVPFSLLLEASQLYQGFVGAEKVLVHGVIDGYFWVGDDVWLFDYKTDNVIGNDAGAILRERYAGQLNVYAQALVAMGLPLPKKFIYSFANQRVIVVD